MNSRPQKIAALLVVVSLHALGIFALFSIPQLPRHQDKEIVFMMIDAPKSQTKSPPRGAEVREPTVQITIRNPEPETVPNPPAALPLVNWDQQREFAVSQAIRMQGEKEASRSGMSALHAKKPVTENEEPRIFRKPIHQRGESERTGDGELITWIDDRCYLTNRPAPGERLDANRAVTVCKKGPASADGNLFDALKPRYLKRKDSEEEADTDN